MSHLTCIIFQFGISLICHLQQPVFRVNTLQFMLYKCYKYNFSSICTFNRIPFFLFIFPILNLLRSIIKYVSVNINNSITIYIILDFIKETILTKEILELFSLYIDSTHAHIILCYIPWSLNFGHMCDAQTHMLTRCSQMYSIFKLKI